MLHAKEIVEIAHIHKLVLDTYSRLDNLDRVKEIHELIKLLNKIDKIS